MSLFEKGKAVRRMEFREDLRRTPYRNPHSEGRRLSESERMGLEKELEGEMKLGDSTYIYRDRCKRAMERLKRAQYRRDIGIKEKGKIARKLKFLGEITGIRV